MSFLSPVCNIIKFLKIINLFANGNSEFSSKFLPIPPLIHLQLNTCLQHMQTIFVFPKIYVTFIWSKSSSMSLLMLCPLPPFNLSSTFNYASTTRSQHTFFPITSYFLFKSNYSNFFLLSMFRTTTPQVWCSSTPSITLIALVWTMNKVNVVAL
jgi:hypothetical protein